MSNLASENPIPQGNYITASRFNNIIYTSGMTPRKDGVLIQQGKVKLNEQISLYKEAVKQATKNALNAAGNKLEKNERMGQVLSLTVYINAEDGFEAHSKVADYASDYLIERLEGICVGSRTAVGVASLPGNAPVEIQLTVAVTQS